MRPAAQVLELAKPTRHFETDPMPDYAYILNPGGRFREPETVKAYSSMPPRKIPMRKQAKTGDKKRRAKLVYRDSFGVSFLESKRWLDAPARAWKTLFPFTLLANDEVCNTAHRWNTDENGFETCWLCGDERLDIEAHHVVPRYDFIGNVCMACPKCHKRVQDNPAALREVLLACWKNNKLCFSWVFLVRARGSWWPFDDLD